MGFSVKFVTSLQPSRTPVVKLIQKGLKRILLLFIFSFSFIIGAFGQKDSFYTFGNSHDPKPLGTSTVVVSCPPATLTLVITGTDPLCNGSADGGACVSVSGGTAPYSYLWSPSNATTACVTGLVGNTYLIEVWDSSLPFQQYCSGSIILNNPSTLQVNITPPTPVTNCFGSCDGSATASAGTSGTPPYSYSWNTTPVQTTGLATGLCAQIYVVTATDANGCSKSKNVNIGQPALLVSNGSSTSITCFGANDGTASVNPAGGNPPYTYSWATGGATTSGISGLGVGTYTCYISDSKSCAATYTTTITEPPLLAVTVTGSNLLCNGNATGSVTATASGGTGAYTYSWAPGGYTTSAVTGLSANTYILTLKDANNCTKTATVTLSQPTALTAAPTSTNVNCFGGCDGTASANAGGGTSPYTYLWNAGGLTTSAVSGLCLGTYTLDVTDANGCTVQKNIGITQPTLLTVTPAKTDESCAGACDGTATATVAGGTTPYTYSWSGGCTTSACASLCANTYSVLVTDAKGCTATASVTVSPPSAIIPNMSSTSVLCFGQSNGTATSNTTGGVSPYTYLWAPGGQTTSTATGLSSQNYSVTITDNNGCTATGTVNVSQPALFTASIGSASPNPLNCNGDCNGTVLANISGGVATYSYAWTNGGTTASMTGLCAGGYTLTATDGNGCTATTNVTFTAPSTLSVTVTQVNASCSGGCTGSISASPAGGTAGYTYSWLPGGQITPSITGQCAGNYTITVTDNKGCTNTQTVTLSSPSAVTASFSTNNVSCSGACDGSATATPSGGTGAYTYSWTGGQTTSTATGLCAGFYNILINDANGCSSPLYGVNIAQPNVLASFVSSAVSSCNLCTGSASVNTSGGTQPYTYLWAPGGQTTSSATGLCVGNYTVDITDANNCANTVTLSITSQINVAMSSSGPAVSCPGSCDASATATASGGGLPYTYSWTGGQTTSTATGLCAGGFTVSVTDNTGCVSTKTVSFTSPPTFTTSASSTTASCGLCNGTATVSAAGGTGALTYSWSGFPTQTTATATGLCPADYTVTITDANNCTTTNTVTVGNVPVISDNASTTLATCGGNDGAICVAPTGGTGAYTYSWNPGGATVSCITGLVAGIYTVTISDAAGCSDDFPISVGNLGGPTVTVTFSVNPTCNYGCDGSISISAAGASPPFSYLWNPGGQTTTSISALCAGTYIVQVDDAAATPCTTFGSVTLSNPAQISGNPTVTDVSCAGGNDGSICLSPSNGTAPYTYEWLPGGQTTSCRAALSAGSYSVVVSDVNGCDDTLLIPVSAPSTLSVTISSTDVSCNGNGDGTATANVSGGTTLYTYAWSTGSGLPGIVGLVPNNYSITVTDAGGCTATASVTIAQPTVLTSTISSTNMSCNSVCDGTATLTASGGTTAYTYFWSPNGETTSAINALCQGNYATTLTDANGCTSTQTVSITQPVALSATVTATNASCFGGCNGSATVAAAGGTGAYTYTWNPGALTGSSVTGLCANSYTLTTADVNGCTTTNVFSISAPTVLQANITTTITACVNTCDGVAISAPVGGTGAYTFLWSDGQTTATATGLCAGTYTLTLSDANGCSISQTANVGSPSALTQSSAVSGATCNLCNGSITVVGSGGTAPYSYFWSTGGTTGTITGLCAGVYIDTVMDANGCISIDTLSLSNTTGPGFTVSSTSVTCNGACNGTGLISGETGSGPFTYLWTFPSGTQTTASVSGLCPNQYFAHVTDVNGCTSIQSINIVEPAALSPGTVVTNATCFGICNGSIVANATGGIGAYTYAWLPGGQTTSSITAQCAGNYTLTLKDANNCTNTTTLTIGQNTILSATVTSTNNSCNSSCNGTATIAVSGGTAPYTYSWTGGQTTSTATGLCANGYTVTVNDAIGCMNISTVTITQPAVLTATISSVNPLCNLSCNGSLSVAPAGGTTPYTYLWMPGGYSTSSVTGLCANNYTLTLSDANNCTLTNTVTLTDPPVLASASVMVNASCPNTCDGSINLTPSGGTGAYTFVWAPTTQTTEDITGLCGGNYSVTISDANACTVSYTMAVGITTVVTAIASNDTSFCLGGTATLTSTSTNALSIGWYLIGSPSWTLIGAANPTAVTPAAPGTFSYGLIALNGICSDTDTVNVTVFSYPVVVANNTTICAGSSASICASGATNYQWYQLPAWTPITTGSCINVSPAVGVTNYGIIGMNGLCSDTDSVAVTVLPMPIANAGTDTAYCQGGSVQLCGTLSQNATTFNWFELPLWAPGDTDTCTIVSPFVTTDYGLIVSNGFCSDTDTVNITIYPAPVANAGPDITVLASANSPLTGTGAGPGGTYLWSPSTALTSTTDANPTANPSVTTTYNLLVTDINGCTDVDSMTITVVNDVKPNDGLSPNGDGINDVWTIPNIEQFPNALVEVYNRWGELLFHSIGYATKWDATYNGKDLPVGTYYFVINLNSDLHPDPITGPITILR